MVVIVMIVAGAEVEMEVMVEGRRRYGGDDGGREAGGGSGGIGGRWQ